MEYDDVILENVMLKTLLSRVPEQLKDKEELAKLYDELNMKVHKILNYMEPSFECARQGKFIEADQLMDLFLCDCDYTVKFIPKDTPTNG